MKKKYIYFLLCFLLILLVSISYFLLNDTSFQIPFINRSAKVLKDLDFEKVYASYDVAYSENEEVWLVGRYLGPGFRTGEVNFFDLRYEEHTTSVLTENFVRSYSIFEDDYLILRGVYDEEFPAFIATSLNKIDEKTYEEIFIKKYPIVEIEILDENLVLSHGCENASVTVRIKNTGELPIDYQKTGMKETNYVFITLIDGEIYSLYPDFDETEKELTGKLFGFRNFGVLQPGEEKKIRFGLGGQVKSGEGGTAGTNHIFCVQRGEEFHIEFGSVRRQDRNNTVGIGYDFVNTYSSNEINVSVETCRCILEEESLPMPL